MQSSNPKMSFKPVCIVCNSFSWLELPSPHQSRSVRSDGAILNQPLLKAQCGECGLVQSTSVPDTKTLATLYTENYDIYNNRPASEQFVASRYEALARAFTLAVAPFYPKKVLEVGCGNGATLEAVQSLWKDAECIGVEPVITAVQAAQSNGINVVQGMIGVDVPEMIAKQKYDVIYTVHVIEHTQDPVAFLHDLKEMLSPEGRLLISCPNASIPNLEIMRSDHNFSMLPYHLDKLTRKAGLIPLLSSNCPGGAENMDYEHNQLLVCRLPERSSDEIKISESLYLPNELNDINRQKLFDARKKYFLDFGKLDENLQSQLSGFERLYCFGSGGWACILAGYAPYIWNKVQACIIDGGSDQTIHGKDILPYEKLKDLNPDGIIVATNPVIQPMIAERLNKNGFKAIRWDNIICV